MSTLYHSVKLMTTDMQFHFKQYKLIRIKTTKDYD